MVNDFSDRTRCTRRARRMDRPNCQLSFACQLILACLWSVVAACNRAEPEKGAPSDAAASKPSVGNDAAGGATADSGSASNGRSAVPPWESTVNRPAGSGVDDSTVAAVAANRQPGNAPGNAPVLPPNSPASSSSNASTAPASGAPTAPASSDTSIASSTSPPGQPGVHIEFSEPGFPSTGLDAATPAGTSDVAERLSDRMFMNLKLPETREPATLLTFFNDCDRAVQDLAMTKRAEQLSDTELAHQGKLVLLGFRLNQLQEGQLKDTQVLLSDIDQLFVVSQGRGLVEMMALQRCAEVLAQLGYAAESKQVLTRIVDQYRSSPDIDLSMRAWSIETDGAPTLLAFHESLKTTFESDGKDPLLVAQSARNLLQTFPGINTLLHVSRFMIPLEFSGNVQPASELAKVVADARRSLPSTAWTAEIDTFLDCHARRLGCVGKPLALEDLVAFDGKPFDWSSYRGKVVLVCFWASWEINSLEEMRRLKDLRQQIPNTDFEIVAINLDDANMSNAEQMISRQAYPWQNLRSSNPSASGFATPAAKSLGVNAVPFLMLVDKGGNVAAIHVRGPKASDMIEELLSKK